MRYAQIRKMDISNGPGIRISIFVQGCAFHCFNCFNSETWDFNGGKEFKSEDLDRLIEYGTNKHVAGLSVLGGEPLHEKNVDEVIINFLEETKKKLVNEEDIKMYYKNI